MISVAALVGTWPILIVARLMVVIAGIGVCDAATERDDGASQQHARLVQHNLFLKVMPARASEGNWRRLGGAPTRSLAMTTISLEFCSVHVEANCSRKRNNSRTKSYCK